MPASDDYLLGQRRSYDGALCTVRYVGQVAGTTGDWLGVEWDDPSRGKHDGAHKGVRYFTCLSKSATAASFVRPARPAEQPRAFLEALRHKYASEVTADQKPISSAQQIVISGKVAEEIGFDKIRRQQAQLDELKIAILDGMRIDAASYADDGRPIREVCPKITELNLSRNLLSAFRTVVDICSQLNDLGGLRLNGNRFQGILQEDVSRASLEAFSGIRELAVDETLLQWAEICHVASAFPSLVALHASMNQLSRLPPKPPSTLASTLTSIFLEYNNFTSLSDVASLASLSSLRNLHLKGNHISTIESDTTDGPPIFPSSLDYLDISYNKIHRWSFVDALPDSFPGLTSLRLAHNPVYDNPALDNTDASSSAAGAKAAATLTEEAYMLTIARLAPLKSLNFSVVMSTDRTNAEMFYLSRIGRQLSSVPDTPEAEAKVTAQHRRYAALCELYGEPVVVRRKEINPNLLEARLINVVFLFRPSPRDDLVEAEDKQPDAAVEKRAQIPKAFDIYAVKGIAGKLFNRAPLSLRLVWETGEWDPVAGFDDVAGDSSEDDEPMVEQGLEHAAERQSENKAGRWIKREVELKDSPRQFGFCVDGLDVTIRVEPR